VLFVAYGVAFATAGTGFTIGETSCKSLHIT